MYYRKKFILFAMLFLLVGSMLPSFVSSAAGEKVQKKVTKKNENFQVDVEYGIDGYVDWDYPVVVRVTIKSNQNFEGTLQVKSQQEYSSGKVFAYGEDITLAAGEAKTFLLTLDKVNDLGKVDVSILNDKQKTLYSEQDKLMVESSGNKIMVGILSDDYSALNYFDGIKMSIGTSSILELTTESFPSDSYALSVLQYIIIDNYDTANLSDDQYEALKEWVQNGGTLVLSLGANYQNVLHKFSDDFVSGSLGELTKKEIFWNKQVLPDEMVSEDVENTALSLPDVDSVDFELKDGTELTAFSDNRTAYKKKIGSGVTVVLSYDLGMEPVASFASNKEMASLLLTSSAGTGIYNWTNGIRMDVNALSPGLNLADMANATKKPSVLLYGLLLTVYLVLVGPLLYLILKKMKKREKIWIAIPVTAVFFTGIIYFTGFLYRVTVPIASTCAITDLNDITKKETVYTNVICPKAKRYQVDILNGYSNLRHDNYWYDYSLFGTDMGSSVCMLKKTDDGIAMTVDSKKAFDNTRFCVSKTSENDIGNLDCDIKCYTYNKFNGTITNNTNMDLKDVIVNFEDQYYCAGDIKKGETISIDDNKLIAKGIYGNTIDSYYANTIPDYYRNEHYKLLGEIYNLLESIYDEEDYNGKCNIWAFAENYVPNFVDAKKVKQTGFGIITKSLDVEYEDIKGVYYPDLESMIVNGGNGYEQGNNMMYNPEAEVTYSFADTPGITRLELNIPKEQTGSVESVEYAEVYAFNPENGNFERIFQDNTVLAGEELQKYISANTLILKYRSVNDNYYNTFIPKIIARGDE